MITDGRSGTGRARRWMIGAVGAPVLLLLLLVTAFYAAGPRQATEWLLRQAAGAFGASEARFEITKSSWRGLEARQLALGSVTARALSVSFGVLGPLGGVKSAAIDGLRVSLDLRTPAGPGETPVQIPVLAVPFPITLSDTVLEAIGPSEVYRATQRGPVSLSRARGTGAFDLAILPSGDASPVRAHHGTLVFDSAPGAPPAARMTLTPEGPDDPRRASLSADLEIAGNTPAGLRLTIKDLRLPAYGAALQALTLQGRVSIADDRLGLTLSDCARLEGGVLRGPTGTLEAALLPLCPADDGKPAMALLFGKDRAKAQDALAVDLVLRDATGLWRDAKGVPVLSGALPTLALQARSNAALGDWQAEIGAAGGALKGPAGLTLSALALKARLAAAGGVLARIDADLTAATLSDPRPAAVLVPVALSGTAKTEGKSVRLRLDGAAAGIAQLIHAEGTHDLARGAGQVSLALGPLRFDPAGLTPAKLSPALAAWVSEAQGGLSASGVLGWGADARASGGTLKLERIEAKGPALKIAGLDGTVKLAGLAPLRTAAPQSLRVKLLDFGLPLTDGLVRFSLEPSGELKVYESLWNWLGGTVGVSAASFKAGRASQNVVFAVHKVDLQALLALADVKGLSGAGRISGRIPVTVEGQHQRVAAGRISADAPGGVLRYQTGRAGGGNDPTTILYTALDNFLFDSLIADVTGDLAGELSLQVHLKGHNPALYDGRRIELNVSMAGAFVDMLRRNLNAARIPAQP